MDDPKSLDELQRKLQNLLPVLIERYQVESIALFGSYVRGEQRPESDLDVLVTFRSPPSLFKFVQLECFLSDMLGVKVDLVMKEALKPRIGKHILREAVPV
jgi:hypothetical protein